MFSLKQMKKEGYKASILMDEGFRAGQLRAAGYKLCGTCEGHGIACGRDKQHLNNGSDCGTCGGTGGE